MTFQSLLEMSICDLDRGIYKVGQDEKSYFFRVKIREIVSRYSQGASKFTDIGSEPTTTILLNQHNP